MRKLIGILAIIAIGFCGALVAQEVMLMELSLTSFEIESLSIDFIGDDSNEAPIIGDPDQELPPETDVKLTGLRNAYSHVTGKLGSGHRAAEAIRVAATRKGIALVENSGEDDSDREEAGDEAIEIGVDTADVFHFSVY